MKKPEDLYLEIGNSIFAIENNIEPFRKRILNGNILEADEIEKEISKSIEKIKLALKTIRNIEED